MTTDSSDIVSVDVSHFVSRATKLMVAVFPTRTAHQHYTSEDRVRKSQRSTQPLVSLI